MSWKIIPLRTDLVLSKGSWNSWLYGKVEFYSLPSSAFVLQTCYPQLLFYGNVILHEKVPSMIIRSL